MKKTYLLAYSDTFATADQIKQWAEASAHVETWRRDLPHACYLVSGADAEVLAGELHAYIGPHNSGRFMITEISENRQGWLPKETWYLLRNKELQPSRE